MDWVKESEMFDKAADYYDKYRPSYPREIIDTLIAETQIKENSKLLEIGAGSGKATELLAGKGFDITCIDPGENLVRMGNEKFAGTSIRFEAARFEEYNLRERYFDAIFAAQSFHWIPKPIGYEKCAFALKEEAFLALFWNMYITYDNAMDNELIEISSKYGGFADFLSEKECEDRIRAIAGETERGNLFSPPKIFRKLWKQRYTAEEYFGFVLTGNRFIQKSKEEKQAAYREIAALADKYNGIIERPYLCVLYVSQKL